MTRSLRERIFSVVPAASFGMDKLLALADIVATEAVSTAAVECVARPRLLINPDFVARYCRTDEHLFMLVMHELHHVLLGHTRLFSRPTPAHNIAFDAIINAMLCHRFREPAYVSFFQETNPWSEFPGRLLRPAPGWPTRPRPLPADATHLECTVHGLLYSRAGDVTYHEVYELLLRLLGDRGQGTLIGEPLLLGDHDGEGGAGALDDTAERDPLVVQTLGRVVAEWPASDRGLAGRGRDDGGQACGWTFELADSPSKLLRAALRRLLAKAGVYAGMSRRRRVRLMPTSVGAQTVLPHITDRRAHAWRRLHGAPPVLWNGATREIRPRRDPRPVAHVYLDVSGSMNHVLPHLGAVLREPHRTGAIRLFVFSTVVDEAKPGDLGSQQLANTGGTHIRCVLDHLAAIPERVRPRRVVLLTDGYVGAVDAEDWEQLQVQLYVGLDQAVRQGNPERLAEVARHTEVLPVAADK
jgi:hypothetical protein